MLLLPWKILFFFMIFLGSSITMSASSWFIAWTGLEVNMLAFLALALNLSSPRNSEATLKYFLVQALASTFFLASALLLSFSSHPSLILCMALSLILKLGGAPLHFWVPQILEGCHWLNLALILTWQKLAPFFLLFSLATLNFPKSFLIPGFAVASSILGGLGGLSYNSLRKILAYSSINHMGWMLSATLMNMLTWTSYFISYSVILLSLITSLKSLNISSLSSSFNLSPQTKVMFFSLLLSFGGLPPFFGFLPKWLILSSLSNLSLVLASILALSSLLSLFYYLRIAHSALLRNSINTLAPFPNNKILPWMFVFNVFGLVLIALF